jgi:hypothetical protein
MHTFRGSASQVVQDNENTVWKAYPEKESGDGTKEYTEREKWVVTNFAFLRSHILRVPRRQAGFQNRRL